MIRHIVLIRFKPELSEGEIETILAGIHAIDGKVPGILDITVGRSESPEKIERGYMHGFVVDLADWAALEAYQIHPEHKRFGASLVDNAVGGIDGILVFDLPVDRPQP